MHRTLAYLAVLAVAIFACAQATVRPIIVSPPERTLSYSADVEPILDKRCVTCHSCYNAACQLKLSSYEGLDRGGSKAAVYSSSRLREQAPTRLWMDASSTPEWRALGFHSITENNAEGVYNDSVMLQFLEAKRLKPVPDGEYRAEAPGLACAANAQEATKFLTQHPGRGMPFGFPALAPNEHSVLAGWLQQGAAGPTEEEQRDRETPSAANAAEIEKWEDFLNQSDAKHAMTARYLFEHFFLAHLNFENGDRKEFFQLVRSTTPPGRPIEVIATRRPYDPPEVERFFYRLRKIHATIVHKTHMVVSWSDATMARYRELFLEPEWLQPPHKQLYDTKTGANPFLIYAQIPPRARYEFLLDHSEYFIRTFIRGPGLQGAGGAQRHPRPLLDPVPGSRSRSRRPGAPGVPGRPGGEPRGFPTSRAASESLIADVQRSPIGRAIQEAFYRAKTELYEQKHRPTGFGLEDHLAGVGGPQDAPLLTVYRHFDSASVHRGALGRPAANALWFIDYSQFERIYYALVAGFDVYGNVSHQVNVRRYMDYPPRSRGSSTSSQFLPYGGSRLPTDSLLVPGGSMRCKDIEPRGRARRSRRRSFPCTRPPIRSGSWSKPW